MFGGQFLDRIQRRLNDPAFNDRYYCFRNRSSFRWRPLFASPELHVPVFIVLLNIDCGTLHFLELWKYITIPNNFIVLRVPFVPLFFFVVVTDDSQHFVLVNRSFSTLFWRLLCHINKESINFQLLLTGMNILRKIDIVELSENWVKCHKFIKWM